MPQPRTPCPPEKSMPVMGSLLMHTEDCELASCRGGPDKPSETQKGFLKCPR